MRRGQKPSQPVLSHREIALHLQQQMRRIHGVSAATGILLDRVSSRCGSFVVAFAVPFKVGQIDVCLRTVRDGQLCLELRLSRSVVVLLGCDHAGQPVGTCRRHRLQPRYEGARLIQTASRNGRRLDVELTQVA